MSIAISTVLLLAAAPAAQATATAQKSSPKWGVDWGEFECTLSRRSADASTPGFALRMIPGATFVELMLINPRKPGSRYVTTPYDVSVGPGGEIERGEGFGEQVGEGTSIRITLTPPMVKRFAAASSLNVRDKSGATIFSASFSGSSAAVSALQQCSDSVLRGWGMDPAELAALRQLPQPPGRTAVFFKASDYPLEALQAEATGTVITRLDVGASGRVDQCNILRSSGQKLLDDKTCSVFLRRGKFKPAINGSGQITAAKVVARTIWALPD